MHFSFWEKDFLVEKYDVTILGAGITGTSTAISLAEAHPGLRVCVVDRAGVSLGASTKNAGFSCFGSPTEILDDISLMGEEKTASVIRMRWEGLRKLKSRVRLIEMDYVECGGYEVFSENDVNLNTVLHKIDWLNSYIKDIIGLADVYKIKKNGFFSHLADTCIFNPYEGSLHPVYMMHELQNKARSLGVVFHMNVNIHEILFQDKLLMTAGGNAIPYNILCVCTNGFTKTFIPDLPVFPARNQVLITKPIDKLPFSGCFHYEKGYYYFRNVGNRILLGGARNTDPENEMTDSFGNSLIIQEELTKFLHLICPEAHSLIDHWWSGILGIGHEKEPIVQPLSESVVCGVRLGGMGVAIGSHLGDLLCGEINAMLARTR